MTKNKPVKRQRCSLIQHLIKILPKKSFVIYYKTWKFVYVRGDPIQV